MHPTLAPPDTIILLASKLASFYEFLKRRQKAHRGTLVLLLDRRQGDRRRAERQMASERRRAERRSHTAAADAMMTVFGFIILHRDGQRYTA